MTSEKCAEHDACFRDVGNRIGSIKEGLDELKKITQAGFNDVKECTTRQAEACEAKFVRLHERIGNEEVLRAENDQTLENEIKQVRADMVKGLDEVIRDLNNHKSKTAFYLGGALVVCVLLQIVATAFIAMSVSSMIQGALGG